jgi:hypothetical protein
MSKRKHKPKTKKEVSTIDLFRSIRKDWNGINPVTRTVESKRKKKPKHKHKLYEEE